MKLISTRLAEWRQRVTSARRYDQGMEERGKLVNPTVGRIIDKDRHIPGRVVPPRGYLICRSSRDGNTSNVFVIGEFELSQQKGHTEVLMRTTAYGAKRALRQWKVKQVGASVSSVSSV